MQTRRSQNEITRDEMHRFFRGHRNQFAHAAKSTVINSTTKGDVHANHARPCPGLPQLLRTQRQSPAPPDDF
jgi:hypothetical protein